MSFSRVFYHFEYFIFKDNLFFSFILLLKILQINLFLIKFVSDNNDKFQKMDTKYKIRKSLFFYEKIDILGLIEL